MFHLLGESGLVKKEYHLRPIYLTTCDEYVSVCSILHEVLKVNSKQRINVSLLTSRWDAAEAGSACNICQMAAIHWPFLDPPALIHYNATYCIC